jgi:hypothetical protein
VEKWNEASFGFGWGLAVRVITVEREAAACVMGRKLPPHDAASIPIGSLRCDWSVTVCSVEGFTLDALVGHWSGGWCRSAERNGVSLGGGCALRLSGQSVASGSILLCCGSSAHFLTSFPMITDTGAHAEMPLSFAMVAISQAVTPTRL